MTTPAELQPGDVIRIPVPVTVTDIYTLEDGTVEIYFNTDTYAVTLPADTNFTLVT